VNILAWVIVGAVAGFLAARLGGAGPGGLAGDLAVGLAGALAGGGLLRILIGSDGGFGYCVLAACVGAAALTLVLRSLAAPDGV
jgi:uncharacterized membrane protein YeaQ/YmgE (transglycosylase-associated protein family)